MRTKIEQSLKDYELKLNVTKTTTITYKLFAVAWFMARIVVNYIRTFRWQLIHKRIETAHEERIDEKDRKTV